MFTQQTPAQPDESLTATLIGQDGNETITAEQVATWHPMYVNSHYALLTWIRADLPRILTTSSELGAGLRI